MRIYVGDTVVVDERTRAVGIVERRDGNQVVVRRPDLGNQREYFSRNDVQPLAGLMADARGRGSKYKNDLSLTGQSTLAQLVEEFGYATGQMRRDSLIKVVRQLERSGLEITASSDDWGRDDTFTLAVTDKADADAAQEEEEAASDDDETLSEAAEFALPELFWPSAMGLRAGRELAFLRALSAREPLLCVLTLPEDPVAQAWLGPTWEGLTGWAFRSAQRFTGFGANDFSPPETVFGGAALLQAFLQPTAISGESPRLGQSPRSLNLVTLRDAEWPVDSARLRALWPGPVFEFQGNDALKGGESIGRLLRMVGGEDSVDSSNLSPLRALLWARDTADQLLGQGALNVSEVLARKDLSKLKGSNEGATSLALKARLAVWLASSAPESKLSFESNQEECVDANGERRKVARIDLDAGDEGVFEVESLSGSGPMEAFLHQKVFSRVRNGTRFSLVVPNDALIWAGPFLADAAHHLGERGRVLMCRADGGFFALKGRALTQNSLEIESVESGALGGLPLVGAPRVAETHVRLDDLAGYSTVRDLLRRIVLWPEAHRRFLKGASRSSGVLLFGPPGCGKSRIARAIAGELQQEVRLLGPADLRGPFIGWGQVMIREQFSWLAEREGRMLVIDELDAVARSRRTDDMHSDEKSDVNELLVQLDRVLRVGRIVVGTTNYVSALDEAVVRSGRIGKYIPVPPPNLEDATAIVSFYLASLEKAHAAPVPGRLRLSVPDRHEVEQLLSPLLQRNKEARHFFCGADLEGAVNDALQQSLQRDLPADAAQRHGEDFAVQLNTEVLRSTLEAVPCSVSDQSLESFVEEVGRFCGSRLAAKLKAEFT